MLVFGGFYFQWFLNLHERYLIVGGNYSMLSYEYLSLVYEKLEKIEVCSKVYYIGLIERCDASSIPDWQSVAKLVYATKNSSIEERQFKDGMFGRMDVYDSEFNLLLFTDEPVTIYNFPINNSIAVMLAGLGYNRVCYAFNIQGDFLYSTRGFVSIEDIGMLNIVACITKDGKRVLYDLDKDKILIDKDIIGVYKLTQVKMDSDKIMKYFKIKLDCDMLNPDILNDKSIIIELRDGLYEAKFTSGITNHHRNGAGSLLSVIYKLSGKICKIDNLKAYMSNNGTMINTRLLSKSITDCNVYRYVLRGNILEDLGYADKSDKGLLTAKQFVLKKIHGENYKNYIIGS